MRVVKAGRKGWRIWLAGLILANVLVALYIRAEQTIYYWDLANYWQLFRHYLHLVDAGPRELARAVIGSTRYGEYNGIPVLALLPFGELFGNSRLSYVLGITNLYALPALCLAGWVSKAAFSRGAGRRTAALGSLLCASSFAFWYPQLRGMVAVGGLALCWGVLVLHFHEENAARPWWRAIGVGILLCGCCLFRRYFIFWTVAFFPAALLRILITSHPRGEKQLAILRLVLSGAIASGLFALLAFPQVVYMLTADVGGTFNIYQAHRNPLLYLPAWIQYTGWYAAFLTGLGAFLALRDRERRPMAVFFLVHFCLVLLLFGRVQVFEKHHYLMLFSSCLPLMVVTLEVAARGGRRWVPAAGAGLLAFGTAHAMIPAIGQALPWMTPILSGQRGYPLVRPDFDAFETMMKHLCTLPDAANENEGVYVLASSDVLNDELVRAWYALTELPREERAHIRYTANKDAARFGFPRELLQARYLLVASPVQLHLPVPHAQSAIEVPWAQVVNGTGFGAAFSAQPEVFTLGTDVLVRVYKRTRPLEPEDVEALRESFLKFYPDDGNSYDFSLPAAS